MQIFSVLNMYFHCLCFDYTRAENALYDDISKVGNFILQKILKILLKLLTLGVPRPHF